MNYRISYFWDTQDPEKKNDFPDTPFEDILILLKMFLKKG